MDTAILANVTPIHKKGDKSQAENYRSISLTSVVGKLLETIVTNHISNHLLKDTQHGFRRHRSCLTNLLEFFHEVYLDYDKNKAFDSIYLDFKKAFDTVPHRKLMTKVRALVIGGTIVDRIENWLTGRKQRVVINGKASKWVNVSGVPQGAVLGPLLFIIYINDLDCDIVSKLVKFADDTKLGNRADTLGNVSNIQTDLNRIVNWADTWQMTFNSSKYKVLHIGNANLNLRL